MPQMPAFLDKLNKHDPDFFEVVKSVMKKAQGPGALDPKTKILIALALDAVGGHPAGTKNLAMAARSLGATDGEIIDVIRLAFLYSGIPGLITGLTALQS